MSEENNVINLVREDLPIIEITQEMIKAGVNVLNEFDPGDWKDGWVSSSDIVRALYGVLLEPNPSAKRAPPST